MSFIKAYSPYEPGHKFRCRQPRPIQICQPGPKNRAKVTRQQFVFSRARSAATILYLLFAKSPSQQAESAAVYKLYICYIVNLTSIILQLSFGNATTCLTDNV